MNHLNEQLSDSLIKCSLLAPTGVLISFKIKISTIISCLYIKKTFKRHKFGHCCKNVPMLSLCSSPETQKLPAVLRFYIHCCSVLDKITLILKCIMFLILFRLFWIISYGLRRKRMMTMTMMMMHTHFTSNVALRSTSVVLLRAV